MKQNPIDKGSWIPIQCCDFQIVAIFMKSTVILNLLFWWYVFIFHDFNYICILRITDGNIFMVSSSWNVFFHDKSFPLWLPQRKLVRWIERLSASGHRENKCLSAGWFIKFQKWKMLFLLWILYTAFVVIYHCKCSKL